MVQFQEEKQKRGLEDLKKTEAENLTQILSLKYKLPYINLTISPINVEAMRFIKEEQARESEIAPFGMVGKKIKVGILSPNNAKTLEAVEQLKTRGLIPSLFMVSNESLERVWERYKELSEATETSGGAFDLSNEEIFELLKKTGSLENIKELIEENVAGKKAYRVSKILEIILAGALSVKASDIHLEPEETYVRIRYRLDGFLTDIINIDPSTYKLILSRIKILSNLKLNVEGQAQDGRFSIKMKEGDIEIRTSILPGAYNESIVLRILNPKTISIPLEELGVHPRLLKILIYEISKPNGMILTTGPTGSGKTTTLYAFLKKVHTPGVKIITIENPIEYHLPGIVQTQTDPKKKYTFLEGLRSSLRQDPDIIMVGEIRDSETAEIAINAALTGHLVFSTLHTNNAAGSFPRLIDLGVNYKVLTSAINVTMAQRLVRKLCPDCKRPVTLSGEKKDLIIKILNGIKDKNYLEGLNTETIWESRGCKNCNFSGFKGRIGVYEAIRTDEKIEEVIQHNPSEREIKRAASPQNILDMKQDGVVKVLASITSLEELKRVVDIYEEDV